MMSVSVESQQETKPLTPVNGRTALKCFEVEIDSKKNIEETENCDPNSLTRVTMPKWTYSKEELFNIKNSPSAKKWPSELPEKYITKDGFWDPEMWYYSEESEKRSASPIESKKKFLMDGLVLSPQGRSFARGCQISSDNKHNVVKQNWNNERDGRNKTSGRIGRGWEQRQRSGSQKGQRNSPVGKNDRKYKDDKYLSAGKGRRRAESYDSQPEWFTCGTICRTDTMELKGFDEPVKKENTRKKRRKELSEDNYEEATIEMNDERQFDINDFFDVAENVLPITEVYEHPMPTSRFSQWFTSGRSRSGSHNSSHNNSRRSSFTDELVEIAGLTLGSPLGTPTSPDGDFLFAPIVPACEPYPQDIHQDPEIDVQPLLDSVIPHKTVKGAMNVEDLEGEDIKESKNMVDVEEQKGGTEAFNKLVETMKASGNLPEKPTPTIPDIPPHLLPRPPSSRDKSRSVSPILHHRSPSPLQLLQNVIGQSPVNFIGPTNQDARVVSPIVSVPSASQAVSDLFPMRGRPLTPDEMYGAQSFTSNNAPDLFEFTGSVNTSTTSKLSGYLSKNEMTKSASKSHVVSGHPTISQSFVPTSVLRKQSEKHDHKALESEGECGDSHVVTPQRWPLFDVPNTIRTDSTVTEEQTLQHDKCIVQNKKSTSAEFPQECLTPHHLPLPRSPVNMTPHSLPLPHTPSVEESSVMDAKQLLTPQSLPLPESPSIHGTCNDSFGIKPLPKPIINNQDCFRRQNVPRPMLANQFRRFPHNTQPRFPLSAGIVRRPVVPNAYNINAANLGRVHPTALALALRNQQYQMARAAAVAAATAAVNRAPIMSPAQAAALMLNQQSAAALHGLLPQVNPQMFHRVPFRPNLPPALQHHQHHVVHCSDATKDNSLSKWFSDAVLNQSQTQLPTPNRGAKVLSVEELERHA